MLFVELKQAHNAEGRYVISLALCPSNPHTLTSFVTMFLAAWLVPAASKCLWIYWRGGLGATEWRLWESCYEVAAITELSNCMLHLQVCPLNVLANQLFQICLLLELSLVSDAPIKTKGIIACLQCCYAYAPSFLSHTDIKNLYITVLKYFRRIKVTHIC